MILSLKISSFVYENLSSLSNTEEISHIVDFDENEEKKEFDEKEKIHQPIAPSKFNLIENFNNKPHSISSSLRNLFFEYTTPPPELI